ARSAWPVADAERAVARPAGTRSGAPASLPDTSTDGVKVASFLGRETRRFYGVVPVPEKLELIWRCAIGSGKTSGKKGEPAPTWSGTGWTGQPALVRDGGRDWLLVGGFDHNLHKIDAETGQVAWEYLFPDVIKGSPTVFANPAPTGDDDRLLVVCGSRRGFPNGMGDPDIAPVRCVTFGSGREVWRLPVPRTRSYSRDADGSGFFRDGAYYQPVESGILYKLDPTRTETWKSWKKPVALASRELLGKAPVSHGGNLVLEASPAVLDDVIYIASGSGHVYGMKPGDLSVVWDYPTGSDLDGTAVPTASKQLLVPVEKQYIKGRGGVLMLDPGKPPADSVVWFFPTGDRKFGDWEGGVIGSVAVNDTYDPDGARPRIAAFSAIDGNLYVVAQDALAPGTVAGPQLEKGLRTPVLVFKDNVGGAISTPVIVGDHIVAAGYDALVHVYRIDWSKGEPGTPGALAAPDGSVWKAAVTETSAFKGGTFESTPIVWDGRIYIGSRDGNVYCLGEK
ncbi:MAG: PQQ-like beta-propeller repeat protein, partial [Actinobacteria bacterium]